MTTTAETPAAESLPTVAKVVLDTRLPQLSQVFEYSIPTAMRESVRVGQRVKVPLRSGRRQIFGWITGLSSESEYQGRLSALSALVSNAPLLAPEIWQLAQAAAERAAGNPSDVLRLAIPTRHAGAEKKFFEQQNTSICDIKTPPQAENARVEIPAPELVLDPPPAYAVTEISEQLLAGNKIAFSMSGAMTRLDTGSWVESWALQLAHTAAAVWQLGRSVIVCVPDYRDLSQFEETLQALKIDDAAVRVDAKQSQAKRYTQHLRALQKRPQIVFGNRSAIYAPAHNLGAILVWDEADPLYNEPHAPYVHTRDAAIIRAMLSGCGLLLTGHIKSADTQRLIDSGFLLSQQSAPVRKAVRHADMAAAPDEFAGRIPGAAVALIKHGLKSGPVLVQVAKPGSARAAVCRNCGVKAACRVCAGPLAYPPRGTKMQCLWCLTPVQVWRCGQCRGSQTILLGAGSRRTAEQFAAQFAGTRIIVSDGETPVLRVDSRPALVIATPGAEPLAAGGYRVVVLLDAWSMLNIPALRVGEYCLRWWQNAAAKCAADGVCMLASGAGPVVKAFLTGNITAYLRTELADRGELLYPPVVRVATVTGDAQALSVAQRKLAEIKETNVLGPNQIAPDKWQLIVRFSYRSGREVAVKLRALVLEFAAGTLSATRANPRPNPRQRIRLKFDDARAFDAELNYDAGGSD